VSSTTSYTDSVANNVSAINVTPTVNQANATVTVNGTTVTSSSASGGINLAVGSNTIAVVVTAQDTTTTKTYTINVTRAAPSSGGGGGIIISAPGTTPGLTNLTTYVDNQGVFNESINAWSNDFNFLLSVPAGTSGKTSDGEPVSEITITRIITPPAFSDGAGMVAMAYEFSPSGVTFSPAVTLRLQYNPDNIPAGVDENSLQIAYYDNTAKAWITLPSTVDTANHYIYAQTTHFTTYAVTYGVKPVPPYPTTTETPSPAEVATTPSVTPAAVNHPLEQPTATDGPQQPDVPVFRMYILVVAISIAIVLITITTIIMLRRRKSLQQNSRFK
jgi:hypothetical protein